jgi:hypothetical protein
MTERRRWRVVLLLAGAALGLAGFSTAAAGAEEGSGAGWQTWRSVPADTQEVARETGGEDPVLGLIVSSGGPGLGYAVSKRVSVAIGYDYVTDETLGLELSDAGALDAAYASHEVMVRALWQF